jgi:hypothetical protein
MATPTPGMLGGVSGTPLYSMPADNDNLKDMYGGKEMPEGLPELKMEDMAVSGAHFLGLLLHAVYRHMAVSGLG